MVNFCSYFDKNYLTRFLVLRDSLISTGCKHHFYILLLDDISFAFFTRKKLKNVTYCKLDDLERKYAKLKILKKLRSKIEYYFTLSPYVPIFFQGKFRLKKLNYLDVDIFFFKNPRFFYKSIKNYSVIIIKQYANPRYGNYNVGWISYNFLYKDTFKILDDWKNKCTDWCFDRLENNLYADQKYLDIWPVISNRVKILEPKYSMISPWDLDCENYMSHNKYFYSYHFHGLKIYKKFFISGLSRYQRIKNRKIVNFFYNKYIKLLNDKSSKLNFTSRESIRNSISKKINYSNFINILKKIKFFSFSIIKLDIFRIIYEEKNNNYLNNK